MLGREKLGLNKLGTISTQYKLVTHWATLPVSMKQVLCSYRKLAPDITKPKFIPKLSIGNQKVFDGTFGKQLVGLNTLGTLDTQNKCIIHWMTASSSVDKIKRGSLFYYRSLASDVVKSVSMPKLFPEIKQGGYIFVTVVDNETTYNLSFEGIETD